MSWHFEKLTNLGSITEGPAWDGTQLLFSNNAEDRIMSYRPETGEITVYRTGTNNNNGLMFDKDGQLYACESGARRIVRYESDGSTTVICDNLDGKRLNSPNDLAIDAKGRIWFTDPRYGDYRDDMELDHESVIRLEPQSNGSWTAQRMTYDTTSPNGILISPNQKTLYVAQSRYGEGEKRELRAYPILEDDTLGEYEVLHNFYPHRGIDGMCLDTEGNIIAAAGWELSGPGGMIYVFAPNGRVLETHPVPVQRPTNCTFGGESHTELYVTSICGSLLRAKTNRRGHLLYPPLWSI